MWCCCEAENACSFAWCFDACGCWIVVGFFAEWYAFNLAVAVAITTSQLLAACMATVFFGVEIGCICGTCYKCKNDGPQWVRRARDTAADCRAGCSARRVLECEDCRARCCARRAAPPAVPPAVPPAAVGAADAGVVPGPAAPDEVAEGSGGGGEVAMQWVGTHFEPVTPRSHPVHTADGV